MHSGSRAVELALKDFHSVFLVDPGSGRIRKVDYRAGRVTWSHRQDPKVLLLNSLPPDVHTLQIHLEENPDRRDYPILMPDPVNTDYLPHLDGIPILTPRHDTLGHMLYAASNDRKRFWLFRGGHNPVLVHPSRRWLVEEVDENQKVVRRLTTVPPPIITALEWPPSDTATRSR